MWLGCVEIRQLNNEPVFLLGFPKCQDAVHLPLGSLSFSRGQISTNLLPAGQISKGQHSTWGKERGPLDPNHCVRTVSVNSLVLRPKSHLTFSPSPELPCGSKGQNRLPSFLYRLCLLFSLWLSLLSVFQNLLKSRLPMFSFFLCGFIYPFTTILLGFESERRLANLPY